MEGNNSEKAVNQGWKRLACWMKELVMASKPRVYVNHFTERQYPASGIVGTLINEQTKGRTKDGYY